MSDSETADTCGDRAPGPHVPLPSCRSIEYPGNMWNPADSAGQWDIDPFQGGKKTSGSFHRGNRSLHPAAQRSAARGQAGCSVPRGCAPRHQGRRNPRAAPNSRGEPSAPADDEPLDLARAVRPRSPQPHEPARPRAVTSRDTPPGERCRWAEWRRLVGRGSRWGFARAAAGGLSCGDVVKGTLRAFRSPAVPRCQPLSGMRHRVRYMTLRRRCSPGCRGRYLL